MWNSTEPYIVRLGQLDHEVQCSVLGGPLWQNAFKQNAPDIESMQVTIGRLRSLDGVDLPLELGVYH